MVEELSEHAVRRFSFCIERDIGVCRDVLHNKENEVDLRVTETRRPWQSLESREDVCIVAKCSFICLELVVYLDDRIP